MWMKDAGHKYVFILNYPQYMAVMVIIFIILFSVSVAALSITSSQQKALLKRGWGSLSNQTKEEVQQFGDCCGFEDMSVVNGTEGHPSCAEVICG